MKMPNSFNVFWPQSIGIFLLLAFIFCEQFSVWTDWFEATSISVSQTWLFFSKIHQSIDHKKNRISVYLPYQMKCDLILLCVVFLGCDCGMYVICLTEYICARAVHTCNPPMEEVVTPASVSKKRQEILDLIQTLKNGTETWQNVQSDRLKSCVCKKVNRAFTTNISDSVVFIPRLTKWGRVVLASVASDVRPSVRPAIINFNMPDIWRTVPDS